MNRIVPLLPGESLPPSPPLDPSPSERSRKKGEPKPPPGPFLRPKLTLVTATPMFGGGVEPTIPDPITVVRPSGIRHALRFWWRATRGRRFATADELSKHETAIFGDTQTASRVTVEVVPDAEKRGKRRSYSQLVAERETLQYALFPFQAQPDRPEAQGLQDLQFELRLTYPRELRDDLDAALWGWLAFGGLGARWRRGCGSLASTTQAILPAQAKLAEIRKWFAKTFAKHCGGGDGGRQPWPRLAAHMLIKDEPSANALTAWHAAVELLRAFRQGPGVGRQGKGPKGDFPGPSNWPEAELIRQHSGRRYTNTAAKTLEFDDLWPRASFGLPINFHFMHELQGDPHDATLHATWNDAPQERMASPLIVKPLCAGAQQAMRYYPMIVRLDAPAPEFVEVTWEGQTHPCVGFPQGAPAAEYAGSPMKKRSPAGDAVEAFWAFAQEGRNNFVEISAQETAL